MRTNSRIMTAILAVLLIAAVGIGLALRALWKDLAQTKQDNGATNSPAASSREPANGEVGSDPAVNMMMAKFGLDEKAASYLAGAKTQVVSQSRTSIHLAFTFPDGQTADQLVTIQPDQHYTPTPTELEEAARTGRQTYDVKFSATPDQTQITLEYFVPYSALPPDVQQAIRGPSSSAAWFQLVPSAWAQSGGEGGGMGMTGAKIGGKFVGALYGIYGAAKKSQDNQNWMDQLDALENCAKNPSNPVTQKAYGDNPTYQQQTVAGIENARSQVQQVTAARYLGQESSMAAGARLGLPGSLIMGSLNFLNDMTLKDVANRQITDIGKSVVPCQQTPQTPPNHPKGDGTIVYHMYRKGYLDYDEEENLVQGTFQLFPAAGGTFVLRGTGELQSANHSTKVGTSTKCKGTSEIRGEGGMGYLTISGSASGGDCEFTERGKVSHPGVGYSDTGFDCRFTNVDVVNGGSYEVQASGEEAQWAKCTLELQPKQK